MERETHLPMSEAGLDELRDVLHDEKASAEQLRDALKRALTDLDWFQWGGLMVTPEQMDNIKSDKVRAWLVAEGARFSWHGDLIGKLVTLDKGEVAAEMMMSCGRCGGNPGTVYLVSGCHHGAWCYAVSKKGKHLADLRNQEYRCEACQGPLVPSDTTTE